MTKTRSRRWIKITAAIAIAMTASISSNIGVAIAAPISLGVQDPGDTNRPAFYQTPDVLPDGNGRIIRSEQTKFNIDPIGLHNYVFSSERILYTSTNRTGERIAVSGTVMIPKVPWIGKGYRPLVAYAPGTQGVADSCAPSRQLTRLTTYEQIPIFGLLTRGYAVVITDYEGLGTSGVHTYLDRVSQGNAVLDSVRAAIELKPQLAKDVRVGINGYSQGGAAAASAAELAASYAPELNIVGAAIGAPPANIERTGSSLDGGLYSGLLLFAVAGLATSYDIDLNMYLDEAGNRIINAAATQCFADIFGEMYTTVSSLTRNGESFSELAQLPELNQVLDDQIIGRGTANFPIVISHSRYDDIIPFSVGRDLARDWCANGANVRFSPLVSPTHIASIVTSFATQFTFLEDRFAGRAFTSNCSTL